MTTAVQLAISGIATGIIYGTLALALVVTYKTTRVFNIALPETSTAAAYAAMQFSALGLPYGAAFAVVVIVVGAVNFCVYQIIARTTGGGGTLRMFVGLFGLFFVIHGVTVSVWGGALRASPTPFRTVYRPLGVAIPAQQVAIIVAAVVEGLLLYVLFRRTSLGLALRATASNPEESALNGIPVNLMLGIGWGISGAIAAVAGVMIAPVFVLNPDMMIAPLVYIFGAWIAGGLDSPSGALAAGVVLGLGDNFVGYYVHVIGNDLKLPLMLAIIVFLLVLRPQGLRGSKEVVRV